MIWANMDMNQTNRNQLKSNKKKEFEKQLGITAWKLTMKLKQIYELQDMIKSRSNNGSNGNTGSNGNIGSNGINGIKKQPERKYNEFNGQLSNQEMYYNREINRDFYSNFKLLKPRFEISIFDLFRYS